MLEGPPPREITEGSYRWVSLWLAGIAAVAGLLGAVAALVTALRGG